MANERPLPWKALREASGLSQREVERSLSWIERGAVPKPEQEAALRAFFFDPANLTAA
jgi:transcriptional regulator with XRE-family HTH domain